MLRNIYSVVAVTLVIYYSVGPGILDISTRREFSILVLTVIMTTTAIETTIVVVTAAVIGE